MKATALVCVFLFLLGIYGILAGFPGICGNAFSLLPANWNGRYDFVALVIGGICVALSCMMGVLWLVLMTRRQTFRATSAIASAKDNGDIAAI